MWTPSRLFLREDPSGFQQSEGKHNFLSIEGTIQLFFYGTPAEETL